MRWQNTLAIFALILAMIGVTYYLNVVGQGKAATHSTIASSTVSDESDAYTIDVEYPTFGIAGADASTAKLLEKALTEFKALPPNPTPIPAKNELVSRFTPYMAGPEIWSALLDIYQFTGGAHGGTVAYGLNFHANGNPVTLDEALELTGKSLSDVAEIAKKELVKRFEMVQFPEGAAPTAQNYATFFITKDAVTFIFQQYQVEAYAAGMPQIVVPRVK